MNRILKRKTQKCLLQSCNVKQFTKWDFVILQPKFILIGLVYNGSISSYKIAITRVTRSFVGVSKRVLAITYLPVFKQNPTRHTLEEILDCLIK